MTMNVDVSSTVESGCEKHSFRFTAQFSSSFGEMAAMRRENQLCDVLIEVDGGHLSAHRVVLASLSPYFKAMFTGSLAESRQEVVRLKGVDYDSLAALINYAYTSAITISEDNVQNLLPAANVLQFEEVKAACSHFLRQQLDPTNCLGIKLFAELHGCKDLAKAAGVYANRYFPDVCKQEEFLKLSLHEVLSLLNSDHLNTDSELEVLQAALEWIKHDTSGRTVHIQSILAATRLHLLSLEDLLERVGKLDLIISDKECVRLLLSAIAQRAKCSQQVEPTPLLEEDSAVCDSPKGKRKPIEQLFAIGGWNGKEAVSTVESIDTETREWQVQASTLQPRNGVGLAVLNGYLFAIGGHDSSRFLSSVEMYDLKSKQWKQVASMKQRRASAGVVVCGEFIYAIGGQDGVSKLKSMERYNPTHDRWEWQRSMNTRRDSPGVVLHQGTIYAIGGCHTCMFLDTVEKYSPQKNFWSSAMHMNCRRSALGAVSLGDYIYAVGGHDERGNLCVVEQYSPATDTWVIIRPMNSPRAGVGAAAIDGKIIAVGGYDGVEQLDSVEEYDPAEEQWRFLSPLKYQRSYIGIVKTLKMV